MSEKEKFKPSVVWQHGKFRIVRTGEEKFEIENSFLDAMRQPSWRFFCNVNKQDNSVAGILWMVLTQPNQGDKMA